MSQPHDQRSASRDGVGVASDLNGATLRYLADMVREPALPVDVAQHGAVVTIPGRPEAFFAEMEAAKSAEQLTVLGSGRVQKMVSRDELHPNEHLLKVGWGWVAGPAVIDGKDRRVLAPLVAVSIRRRGGIAAAIEASMVGTSGGWRCERDRDGSHLIADPVARAQVAEGAEFASFAPPVSEIWWRKFPRLQRWLTASASTMGFPDARVRPPSKDLEALRSGDELVVVPMTGIFLARDLQSFGRRPSLEAWATRGDGAGSAFSALYGAESESAEAPDTPIGASILALDPDQQRAVARARSSSVSVVAGPPGTGKSHTVAAMAADAVHRGERVLIATQSQHAASVIIDFLVDSGVPPPVVFGDNRSREEMVAALIGSLGERSDDLDHRREAFDAAVLAVRRSRESVAAVLRAEARVGVVDPVARVLGERLTEGDLDEATRDLALVRRRRAGWWDRYRARRRLDRRAETVGSMPALIDEVAMHELRQSGGLELADVVDEQIALATELRRRFVGLVRSQAADRLDRGERTALADLGRALRSGRGPRREMLAQMDADALLSALPLWVGTIGDIDDLLPPTPRVFDLVIIDEASQVDQTVAPPALLRARRLVAAGDPHQLRHTSFTADAAMTSGLETHGLATSRRGSLLDVRRNSVLDVAAAAGPTTLLTTHYRSVPHLIEFSARRYYDGRVAPATRHPAVDTSDRIDLVRVAGRRTPAGTNPTEVDAVIELLQEAVAAGERSIGVVTPFRAQADLLEDRIVDTFDTEVIVDHRIAVGTVHSFQGAERDHVVISLAVDDESSAGSFRFLEDRHLFNVMVTRARERCTVITSLVADRRGTLGDYFAYGEEPGAATRDRPIDGWPAELGGYLRDQGLTVRAGYPVGHESIDLVVGDGADAFALDCTVHPDGPEAHLRRRLMLAAQGWKVVDGFASRWAGRGAEFAIRVAQGDRPRDPGR